MATPFPNFLRELNAYCRRHHITLEPFRAARRPGNTLKLRLRSGKIFFLYAKLARASPPRWDINENKFRGLNQAGEWYLILLMGDEGEGIVLADRRVRERIEHPIWPIKPSGGRYEIHSKRLRPDSFRHFTTFGDLFDYLVSVAK
jgi:hypothetical protein